MPLLSEIKYSTLTSKLKSMVKENEYDVVLGTMTVSQGVLVLLFSHRYNKEVNLLVTDGPSSEKVLSQCIDVVSHAE